MNSAAVPGNGTISVDFTDIVFTGLEPITASVFDSFAVVTPNSNDDLRIEVGLPGQSVLRGTSGGVPFEELSFFDIANVVVDMATHDAAGSLDRLVLSAGDMPATGVALLVVDAGSGTNSLIAESGVKNVNTSVGADLGRNLDVTVSGASTRVNLLQSQELRTLTLVAGLVSLEPNNAQTILRTAALDLAGGSSPVGTLDLHDNGVIVVYSGPLSPYGVLQQQIINARNQNAPVLWAGTGITSSVAAVDQAHAAVGYAEAVPLFNENAGMFMGQSVGAGGLAVLIRATRAGDANLDGVTDGSDFNHWNANKFGPGDWLQGDFNYDASVDGSDFNYWNANKFQSFDQVARNPSIPDGERPRDWWPDGVR